MKNNNKVRVYYFPKGLNLALPTAVDLLLPKLHFHSKAEIYQSLKKTIFSWKTQVCAKIYDLHKHFYLYSKFVYNTKLDAWVAYEPTVNDNPWRMQAYLVRLT